MRAAAAEAARERERLQPSSEPSPVHHHPHAHGANGAAAAAAGTVVAAAGPPQGLKDERARTVERLHALYESGLVVTTPFLPAAQAQPLALLAPLSSISHLGAPPGGSQDDGVL